MFSCMFECYHLPPGWPRCSFPSHSLLALWVIRFNVCHNNINVRQRIHYKFYGRYKTLKKYPRFLDLLRRLHLLLKFILMFCCFSCQGLCKCIHSPYFSLLIFFSTFFIIVFIWFHLSFIHHDHLHLLFYPPFKLAFYSFPLLSHIFFCFFFFFSSSSFFSFFSFPLSLLHLEHLLFLF